MRYLLLTLGILAVLAGIPSSSGAQPLPERDLPPALRPWAAWVRDEISNEYSVSHAQCR